MKLVKQFLGKVSITVDKDPWSINKAYDRLTIVGTSDDPDSYTVTYISRKPVPKGISLTNTEYWKVLVKTDNVTQQVLDQVNDAVSTVDAMQSTVDGLSRDLASLDDTVTNGLRNHEGRIETNEEAIGILNIICSADEYPDNDISVVVSNTSALVSTINKEIYGGQGYTGILTKLSNIQSSINTLFNQTIPEYVTHAGYRYNNSDVETEESERPIYGTYKIIVPSNISAARLHVLVECDGADEFIHEVNSAWSEGKLVFKLNGVPIPMSCDWDGDGQLEFLSTYYYSAGTYIIEL